MVYHRSQYIQKLSDLLETDIHNIKDFRVLIKTLNDYSTVDDYFVNPQSLKEGKDEIQTLLLRRKEARQRGDYVESDRLRDEILKRGYRILDLRNEEILKKI